MKKRPWFGLLTKTFPRFLMDAPFDVVEAMNGINIISLSPCHDGFEAKNLLGSQHTSKKGMNEKNALIHSSVRQEV